MKSDSALVPAFTVDRAVRPGHVLRLADVRGAVISELVESVSPEIPVVLDYRGPDERTARQVTTEVLDALEGILFALFPSWLPGRSTGDLLDVDEAGDLARELCSSTGLPGSVVIDVSRAAAAGRAARSRAVPEVRAGGLVGLLRHSYGRDAVVLAVRASDELSPASQLAAYVACEWLAEHGRLTVWLTADALPSMTRAPQVRLGLTTHPDDDDAPADGDAPLLAVSRPVGAPAPHSRAEQALEHALARQPWARDRLWNRSPRGLAALSSAIVVDLMWSAERVIVEVDGADHRRPEKYARDRARDNMLQRNGFLVLRYTNDQVLTDTSLVIDELAEIIAERNPETEEPLQWTTRS